MLDAYVKDVFFGVGQLHSIMGVIKFSIPWDAIIVIVFLFAVLDNISYEVHFDLFDVFVKFVQQYEVQCLEHSLVMSRVGTSYDLFFNTFKLIINGFFNIFWHLVLITARISCHFI